MPLQLGNGPHPKRYWYRSHVSLEVLQTLALAAYELPPSLEASVPLLKRISSTADSPVRQ